jgi:hypothetical protein
MLNYSLFLINGQTVSLTYVPKYGDIVELPYGLRLLKYKISQKNFHRNSCAGIMSKLYKLETICKKQLNKIKIADCHKPVKYPQELKNLSFYYALGGKVVYLVSINSLALLFSMETQKMLNTK